MTIDVDRVDDPASWNDLVERSPDATPFHRHEFLETAAEYSDSTLHPLVGYKGQEVAGLFPVFELQKGPVATAFSPPPDLKMTYLGPALSNAEKLSQRKRERRNRRLVEACLETVEADVDPKFVNLRTTYRYDDPRPFLWNDFDPTPRHTYVVDLEGDLDDLLMAFSRDARKNVRTDLDYEIREGAPGDSADLVRRIEARHAEQDVDYDLPPSFVADLHERVPAEYFRSYVCEHEGAVVGGRIVLADEETAYAWQSWADHDADLPAADVLHWRVIRDAAEAGRSEYDLVGANDPRLSSFKAKYAPELRSYAGLRRGSTGMTALAGLYDRFRK